MPSEIPTTGHGIFTPALAVTNSQAWQPPADVYRVAGGWLVKFELAGVSPDDVTVTVQESRLVVRGVRLDRCLEAGCSVHRMEIAYNWFERVLELPDDLSRATVRRESSHGMLIVRVTPSPAT
jgi:HSP20 family protein